MTPAGAGLGAGLGAGAGAGAAVATRTVPGHRTPVAATAVAVGLGAVGTLQSRLNGELGARSGDGLTTALISNTSALGILCLAVALSPGARRGFARVSAAVRDGAVPWWYLLGGLPGAVYALSQGTAVVPLGIAVFMVTMVAGQVVGGLVIDRLGLAPGASRALTGPRVVGAGLALVASAVAVPSSIGSGAPLWLLVLPALAGVGQSWQQAVNGRVKEVASSAITATAVSYAVGTLALVAVVAVHHGTTPRLGAFPGEVWLYGGGLLGCVLIAGSAIVVRTTGVLVLGLSLVAGQLVCALALEAVVPSPGRGLTAWGVAGAVLALVAVAVAHGRTKGP